MTVLWDTSALKGQNDVVMPGHTIPEMFWNGVAARGDKLMMREKKFGIWQGWSWNQSGTAVREIAMGLSALGFEPGQCASILANTRLEWVLADLAVLSDDYLQVPIEKMANIHSKLTMVGGKIVHIDN